MAMQIRLSYNPYKVKTKLIINGKEEQDEIIKNIVENKRLQTYIDKLLVSIFSLINEKDIEMVFVGTALDYEDVKDACLQFNKNNAPCCIKLSGDVSDESIYDKTTKLKKLFEKAKKGPFDEFRSEQMKHSFQSALAPEFEVNVIATMSSGKSTVINAMLGKELMPSKNEACTATIAKIEDHDDMDKFQAKRYNTKQELLDDWTDIVPKEKGETSLLERWNDDTQTSLIQIRGDIPEIDEREGIKMVLVDTPGPNNSRDVSHKTATVKAIKEKQLSMVLYILNATQLSTDDDSTLLNLIKDVMAQGGREAQDRFIFIANKIDNFDPEKGESVESALEHVRNYLKENGILNPLVIPASAELAKLIRINKFEGQEALTRKQRSNLISFVQLFIEEKEMNMLSHVKDYIDCGTYSKLEKKVQNAKENGDENSHAEVLSGIPIVEALLDNFISKHAMPAKLKDAVDSFSSVMASADAIKKLNHIISNNEESIEQISQKIDKFVKDKDRIEKAATFRSKVEKISYKISESAKNEQRKIDKKIKGLLDGLQERFEEKISPSEAKKVFFDAQRDCEFLFEDIQVILTISLKDDFLEKLNSLRDEYQAYIKDLLDKTFPNSEDISLKEFQDSAMQMPDVSSLIKKNTFKDEVITGTRRVSMKKWYNPFSWFDDDKVEKIYKNVIKVDMSEVFEELANAIRKNKMERFEEFENLASENVKSAKKILLEAMDEIDAKMQTLLDEIENANKDKQKAQKMVSQNKEKLAWFDEFKKELDEILSI